MARRQQQSEAEAPEVAVKLDGITDGKPNTNPVGEYEEKPYGQAITPAHREFLAGEGFEVPKKAESEQAVVGE